MQKRAGKVSSADKLNRRVRVVLDSGDSVKIDRCRRNLSKDNLEDITVENFRQLWPDYFQAEGHAKDHDHFGQFQGSQMGFQLDFRTPAQKQASMDLDHEVSAETIANRAPPRGPQGDVGPSGDRSAARKNRRYALIHMTPVERVLHRKSYKAANHKAHLEAVTKHPKRHKKPGGKAKVKAKGGKKAAA